MPKADKISMNQAFIKHFGLTENDVKQAEAQLAQGFTELECLFIKKLVDPHAYIAWAKAYYGLPVLKPDFLEKNNNIENLLARYRNVFPRCVIPFHEWDGVLYVMCLEPVTFKAPQPIQYILAPFEVIQKYSSKIESKASEITHIDFPVEKTEVTNPLFKTLATATETKSSSTENFALNFGNIKVEKIELANEPENPSVDEKKLEEHTEADGAPAGFNFPEFKPEKPNYVSEKPVIANDLKSLNFDKVSIPETKTPEIAPTPVAPAVVTPKSLPSFAVIPTPLTPKPEGIPTTPVFKTEHPQGYKNIFELMKKYFQQSMILNFNNGVLTPASWDETWTKLSHAQAAIDTTTPSIFRIVKETLKPFHGYVIQNPINNSFFQTWNGGKYPEHITICPVYENKLLYGMILGTTTKESAKKYQLHHIEEIAQLTLPLLKQKKAA